jgi:glycine betaine/proline transport system substrate-binding protein
MRSNKISALTRNAIAAVAVLLLATSCSAEGGQKSGFAENKSAGTSQSVVLLDEPWADLQVENVIAKQILGKLGYSATIESVAVSVGAQSMENGRIDAFLGNWWPSQKPTFGALIDQGKVQVLGTLVDKTRYGPAVTGTAGKKLGITSLADLAKNADAFDRKFYGIEAGTPGNAMMQKMIDNNDYGLGDWELVESSTSAMLTQVERAEKSGQSIAFLAWSPHWMVPEFSTVFLNDPNNSWGEGGEIRTIVRADYSATAPDITKFLGNLKFSTEDADAFYLSHDKKGQTFDEIANAWITANPEKVKAFLTDVNAADGKPADPGMVTR